MTDAIRPEHALREALEAHRAGQLERAADLYRRAYEQDRANADASYGLGTVLHQQGRNEEALQLLEQAVAAAPAVPEYAFNRGCVYHALGRTAAATHDFMQAAESASGDPGLLIAICRKLMTLGHHYAACNLLSTAAQRMPESRPLWLNLAHALGRVRDYAAAINSYRHALAMQPGSADELLAYADLLFMARQPDAARQALLKARELGADSPLLYYLQARCEKILGNAAEARTLLQRAIDKQPAYGHAWQQLLDQADATELREMVDACRRIAEDKAEKISDRIVLLYTAGRAAERLADFAGAFALFQQANALQREDAQARNIAYDAPAMERFIARMRTEFANGTHNATANAAGAQPIFIVGMPRSGTTLVERIIGGLAGVETGGESEALELVASQYYWAVDHGRAKPAGELQPAGWEQLAQQYWRLQMGPARRLTDKLPTNFRHVGLIRAMFPDAPIVYLRRDPRDVGLSIYSRNFADGHPYATALADIAHFYRVSEQLMNGWQALYPGRILELNYEQLVAEPESQTRALAEFCGLEWRPECLEFHQRTDASFTFSELQVREPLNRKGIGRWRHYAEALQPLLEAFEINGVQLSASRTP